MCEKSVRVNRAIAADRYRYICPNGHTAWSWTPRSDHLHCQQCYRTGVHSDHLVVIDQRDDEILCWCDVEVVPK